MKKFILPALVVAAAVPAATLALENDAAGGLLSDVKNRVGTGSNAVTLTVTWGDRTAVDNLTEAVNFDGSASVGSIIETALSADPRFYALSVGGERVAYGFDTNGDNSAGVKLGDETTSALETGVVSVAAGTDVSAAAPSCEYDHWCMNSTDTSWVLFVNGKAATTSTSVSAGDDVVLTYTSTSEYTAPDYRFYLRPATQVGAWFAGDIHLSTENGKTIEVPMLSTWGDGKVYTPNQYNPARIDIVDADGNSCRDYSASVANSKSGNQICKITVSSPSEAYLRPGIWCQYEGTWQRVSDDSSFKVTTTVAHPLTAIGFEGMEDGDTLYLDNMGVYVFKPAYAPADADFQSYKLAFGDDSIVSVYTNVNSLVAHKAGETTVTISSPDGSCSSTYTLVVKGPDPEDRPESFTNGMIWLNEEWFSHTSGSLNYIDPSGKIYYRAYGNQNDNMAFGATSQFATVYGNKLIVMSKQAWDGGDSRPRGENPKSGGRIVVADATTFKFIAQLDNIGGDGRSCVGVTPHKAYLGTTEGVKVFSLDDYTVTGSIEGAEVARNGQIGDMVKAGRYVYATNVGTSVLVIDAETDTLVKDIALKGVQGVIQSADGRVWMACSKTLSPVNTETLEADTTYTIPGGITCSSGSWRHINLMAGTSRNVLLWSNGGAWSTNPTLYRWDLDSVADPSALEPVYTYSSTETLPDNSVVNYGNGYASPGYDDATDTYMFCTMPGSGTSALINWYFFVDASTGEVKHKTQLPLYWWFPAMPVNPDNYRPEFPAEGVSLRADGPAITCAIDTMLTDRDNIDANIIATPVESVGECDAFSYTVVNGIITITPKPAGGDGVIAFNTESNGVESVAELKVSVAPVLVESITITPAKVDDFIGFEYPLTAAVLPDNASNKAVIWTTTDDKVGTVDANGLLKLVGVGECQVIATAADGSEAADTISVKVNPVLVESVEVTPATAEAVEGTTVQLTVTVLPDNATDKEIVWSSSDETVASVDTNGLVTLHKEGNAVITATAADGSGCSATCAISAMSGLVNIVAEGEQVDVYTLNGVLVKRNATAADVTRLARGIYVIKGAKFIVR